MTAYTVAIVGAGPYGLAAAAHLKSAGVSIRVFGESMEFWQRQMPIGMCLRSTWDASHISDPHGALTLDQYQKEHGVHLSKPLPLADFVRYGQWFQRQVVPDLDCRRVARIESNPYGFRVGLADGESILCQRVVIATGLTQFDHRPAQFAKLPRSLVSHSAEESDLGRFAGQKVVVVGGGQSAVESAALLSEGGADVELIIRSPEIRWLGRTSTLRRFGPTRRLLYHPTDVGPPGLSQLVAHPDLFRRLPMGLQDKWAYRAIRPAAASWLRPRITKVQQTTGRTISSVNLAGTGLQLTLDDGTERRADHVLLATGYSVDVNQYPFLAPELVRSLKTIGGYPRLTSGFEASQPGLHFLGAPAAKSFGPLMRFVSGTDYAAHAVTRRVLGFNPSRTGRLERV
jgi:thioredoxin reductase